MFNIEDLKIGEIQFMITKIRNDGRRVKEIRISQESMGSYKRKRKIIVRCMVFRKKELKTGLK